MKPLALVLIGIACLVHVWIFVLESIRWTEPGTRRLFELTEQDARTTRSLAFNQGFYNLFLAVVAASGIGFTLADTGGIGAALIFAGAGSMVAAAVVLVSSGPGRARAATIQGLAPALGLILLTTALLN